jgi:ubiquinone/menaquinone biosynthesis C-methylase UbiE
VTKSLVQRQFGAHAAAYSTSTVHAKGASLARLIELTKPHKTWRALDVATGAGHTAAAFAPHVASVIASDLTEEMLAEAAALAASKGFANMTTARADAEALPFADASFELVTCRIAPHHFPDVPTFVAEARRVLVPGGELRFASDDSAYAAQALVLMGQSGVFDWLAAGPSDWRERPKDWPETRYERKALGESRKPAYLRFERI